MAGPVSGLNFWETYFSCVAGAIFSSAIFFFSASFFMDRAAASYRKKLELSIQNGTPIKKKRKFTRMNKFIVRMKRTVGIVGICFWAPLFLSIPGGSIVVAKFYGHEKRAYPMVILGIFVNGLIITGIVYLF